MIFLRKDASCDVNMVMVNTKLIDVPEEGWTPQQEEDGEMIDALEEGMNPEERVIYDESDLCISEFE